MIIKMSTFIFGVFFFVYYNMLRTAWMAPMIPKTVPKTAEPRAILTSAFCCRVGLETNLLMAPRNINPGKMYIKAFPNVALCER